MPTKHILVSMKLSKLYAYRDKARSRLRQTAEKRFPDIGYLPLYELFEDARTRHSIAQRARLAKDLMACFTSPSVCWDHGQRKSLADVIGILAKKVRGTTGFQLLPYTVRIEHKEHQIKVGERCVETKLDVESDNYSGFSVTEAPDMRPVFDKLVSADISFRLRSSLRFAVTLSLLVSIGWGLAYLNGYPPPQRFLLKSDRTAFSQFEKKCEDMDYLLLSGHRHDSKNPHFLDSLLPERWKEKRERVLCAEKLYRHFDGDLEKLEPALKKAGPTIHPIE